MSSATLSINAMAILKKERGEKVYNFSAGDPVLPVHPEVIKAVTTMIQTETVLYAPVEGFSELRNHAVEWMNTVYGCNYKMENILVTAGGKFALYAALQHLIKEGDEVLIPGPYWVSYPQITHLFKGIPIFMPTSAKEEWKLTPEVLKKHCSARAKVLILNNPGNPTGNIYSKEELSSLLEIAHQKGIFAICDEVYSGIVYDQNRFYSCGALAENVLVVQSCSKNCAMTGWRVGFAFGPKELIQGMTALQGQSTTGPSTVSQRAALAAFKHYREINTHVNTTMQKRRDFFMDHFNTLFQSHLQPPPAGLYAFIPLSIFQKSMGSEELCTELMTKSNIACVPGISFGQEGYLRMAFSEKEEVLHEGLLALQGALLK